MADLLIPDVELPTIFAPLHITVAGDGSFCAAGNQRVVATGKAVEVPDHGRLIDADAFAAKYVASLPDALADLNDPKDIPKMTAIIQALLLDIAEADTIIPASKEGDE